MKIAIVGGAKASQMAAPFEDESFEIWVLANQIDAYQGKRVTRIFELHENLSEHSPEYAPFIAHLGIPLVVSPKFPVKAEHITVYPYEESNKYLGHYFTSSSARLVAMALLEFDRQGDEENELQVFGFNMAVNDHEYFHQRPCMEAWLAYAKGVGVKVSVHDTSPLLKSTYDEGRDWNNDHDSALSEKALLERAEYHKEKMEHHRILLNTHDGSRQTYETLAKVARAEAMGQIVNLGDLANE